MVLIYPFFPSASLVLSRLKLRHFRCFDAHEVEFAPGLNVIVGPNARGKTSLLEAACVLLRLQSPRITRLLHAIQHERRGFVVDGYFGERHLQFYLSRERKKLALDEVEQKIGGRLPRTSVAWSISRTAISRSCGAERKREGGFWTSWRPSGMPPTAILCGTTTARFAPAIFC